MKLGHSLQSHEGIEPYIGIFTKKLLAELLSDILRSVLDKCFHYFFEKTPGEIVVMIIVCMLALGLQNAHG